MELPKFLKEIKEVNEVKKEEELTDIDETKEINEIPLSLEIIHSLQDKFEIMKINKDDFYVDQDKYVILLKDDYKKVVNQT